jgi:hypothetical protein
MASIICEAIGVLLVALVALHSVVLHIRLSRFRRSLSDAGQILPNLDASVGRMTEISEAFAQRLQADMQAVEDRIAVARRLGVALAAANHAAEEATNQLERLLAQHRRLTITRAEAIPREMVEPKGFAQRAGLRPAVAAGGSDQPAVAAPVPFGTEDSP